MSLKSAAMAAARAVLPRRTRQQILAAHVRWMARRDSGDLIRLAKLFGTDKWGSHWYAQHYQRHFGPLRKGPLTVLEIGIGGYDNPGEGGRSLRAWKAFFPNSQIVGIDIHPKKEHEEARIRVFQGSQEDPAFLSAVLEEIGPPDIIIDDGSHLNRHMIASFEFLFPRLKDGGIYAVEDVQTSYWPTWGGELTDRNAPNTCMGYFRGLVDGLNHSEFLLPTYTPSYHDQHIVAIHFYHNLLFVEKGDNTQLSNMVRGGILGEPS